MLPERPFAAVETMSAGREFEEFDRNAVAFHSGDKLTAVFRRHGFVIDGVSEKRGRSVGGDLCFVGIEGDEFRFWMAAKELVPRTGVRVFTHRDYRIDEPGEIGPAA